MVKINSSYVNIFYKELEWLYWLRSAKLALYGWRKPLYAQIVLCRLCAERKGGTKLYFCAVFALFVFFVGIHILFAKTKDC